MNKPKISFKKLIKILNICHIYIPLVHVKANNSTDLSLNIVDMAMTLGSDKTKYKRFVELQRESLELILKTGFKVPYTINSFFVLLTRYLID